MLGILIALLGCIVAAIAIGIYFFGLTLGGLVTSSGLGVVWTALLSVWTSFTYWIEKGLDGSSVLATVFVIGYVALVVVLACNILYTAQIRGIRGVSAIR